jgi:hypothetical protein
MIAVTPLHFQLTDEQGMAELEGWDLGSLVAQAPVSP